jgi:hypothetical protein
MSKKKQTRLYDTVPAPYRPPIKGLTVYDPDDAKCHTWYCLSDAVIDATGQITMHTAGVKRGGVDLFHHWRGSVTIPPDHPEYEKFKRAVEEAKKPEW